jgi:hypothetical protein
VVALGMMVGAVALLQDLSRVRDSRHLRRPEAHAAVRVVNDNVNRHKKRAAFALLEPIGRSFISRAGALRVSPSASDWP